MKELEIQYTLILFLFIFHSSLNEKLKTKNQIPEFYCASKNHYYNISRYYSFPFDHKKVTNNT